MAAVPSLSRLLRLFPYKPSFAFAYGSRVARPVTLPDQTSGRKVDDMLDLTLVVDDPHEFHSSNLKVNQSHYSFLRLLGPSFLTKYQESLGAKVYYNTLVRAELDGEQLLIKYGIIKTQHLINDLLDWESLYIAGRLHKPIQILSKADSQPLTTALNMNLRSAIHAALLMHDETISEKSLYKTITSLSYSGDFRMLFGENKNKVADIVDPQVDLFRKLYHPILMNESMQKMISWNESTGTFVQDLNPAVTLHHLNLLPKEVQKRLYIKWNKRGSSSDLEDVLQYLSKSYAISDKVKEAVDGIVRSSSIRQTLKGIPMAGLSKSFSYARRKVTKMLLASMRQQPAKPQIDK